MIIRTLDRATKSICGTIALTLALFAAASSSGYAEPVSTASETSLFLKMDANKDGLINQRETFKRSLLALEFDNFDKNQDGSLSTNEFQAFIMFANI